MCRYALATFAYTVICIYINKKQLDGKQKDAQRPNVAGRKMDPP